MRINLIVIVSLVAIFFAGFAFARKNSGLDKTGWFDCLDSSDCRVLAGRFKVRLKREHSSQLAFAVVLSSLLAEYLREEGCPVNLGVINEAQSLVEMYKENSNSGLVLAMIHLVMGETEKTRSFISSDFLEGSGVGNRVSLGLLAALSYQKIPNLFVKYCNSVLSVELVPFLTIGWARVSMDHGSYSVDVYKRLRKIYKKFSQKKILTQMIRCLCHQSNFKMIDKLVSKINLSSVEGKEGSEFLTEWARCSLKSDDPLKASTLLNRAIVLDPDNHAARSLLR